jgi:hypothetical protein
LPVDKVFALKQLERMACWSGQPETDEEFSARAEFLAEISGDETSCISIVEQMRRTLRFFPLPVDIENAARAELGGSERQPPEWTGSDPKCILCADTGWLVDCAGARRCSCVFRRALKR